MAKVKRTLILNVDRDDDIGSKTGMRTPLIGRDVLIEAGKRLLLNDPEDPDGNALFAAVKVYDTYSPDEGEEKEVAAISGSPKGGVEADKKMVRELEEVLKRFPADNIILVTDGYSDSEILPVIASRIPISSIRHVVVKHSRSVEETYAIIGRYLKMIWREAPYRQYALGIPGIILVIVGLLHLLNLTREGIIAGMLIVGGAMIVKGFGIDEYVMQLRKGPIEEVIRLFAYIATGFTFTIGTYIAFLKVSGLPEYGVVVRYPERIWAYGAYIIGTFLQPFFLTLLVSTFIYAIGMLLYNFFSEVRRHTLRYLFMMLISAVIYIIGEEAALILINPMHGITRLLLCIGIGLSVLFTAITLSYIFMRIRRE
ncbi:hypothetical protein B6U99_01435 [Candidatus Geothermarchaeota archaeon ex4572_27]|nr:MAG: hypothetical protein B6U99_01435 [Candidatus Geothermarchaeota archaeon ex4572_27]